MNSSHLTYVVPVGNTTCGHKFTALYTRHKRLQRVGRTLRDRGEESAPHAAMLKCRQRARGAKTRNFLENDVGGRLVERTMVLNCCAQAYFNKLFATDRAVSTYSERQAFATAWVVCTTDQLLDELREECTSRNVEILSGKACMAAQCDHADFSAFKSDSLECLGNDGKPK